MCDNTYFHTDSHVVRGKNLSTTGRTEAPLMYG